MIQVKSMLRSLDPRIPSGQVVYGVVLLLGILLIACRLSADPRPLTEFEPGSLLFQDDFSDPMSGWDRRSDAPDGSLDYQDQAYHLQVEGDHKILWSTPGLEFNDTRLEVDVSHPGNARDDDYGLICRAMDDQNFYYLVISSDGYYGIGKVIDGEHIIISADVMSPSEAILQGNATNHLRADCVGDTLTLYANGLRLASVKDADFPEGRVGLLLGTLETPRSEIFFDNFSVFYP